jgi:predicted ArsR family transcriptional regulator
LKTLCFIQTGGLSVKQNQSELMNILQSTDKWLTASEIAERLDVHPNKVRRLICGDAFKDVQKGIYDTGKRNGGKYVAVFKLVEKRKSNVDDALNLAKLHTGIWGQLAWSNQIKVDRIER